MVSKAAQKNYPLIMSERKEVVGGCLILVTLFLAVGFVLPWAVSFGISSENLSSKVFAFVFLGIMLLVGMIAIPDLMRAWVAILIVGLIVFWLFPDSLDGNCVPKLPGDCA
jgi:hypothetical protein